MNILSDAGMKILKAGYEETEFMFLSPGLYELAKEVYDVPEKPSNWKIPQKTMPLTIGVPVSGGLDSTICYFLAEHLVGSDNVKAYYIDLGQDYMRKEMEAIDRIGIRCQVIKYTAATKLLEAPNKRYDWKHIIPGRNLIIIARVAEQMHGGTIFFGAVKGEIKQRLGGDKSERFFALMSQYLANMAYPIRLDLPLAGDTKATAIQMIVGAGLKIETLRHTISCYSPEPGHCGKCQACLRRYIAFKVNGIELDDFNTNIKTGTLDHQMKYLTAMKKAIKDNDFSQYDEQRCNETLSVLEKMK